MKKTNYLFWIVSLTLVFTLVNSYFLFNVNNRINALGGSVAGAQAGEAQQQPSPQQPRIQASADDDPVKGSADAKITIVEFSDFQCPFCARFYTETLPMIEKNYIDTGKVKLVYRDFPLSFHQNAQKAAEAAECADEQGAFWDYHNSLFENQDEWSSAGAKKFVEYASGFGLDEEEFNDCLDSGKYKDEVQNDFSAGSGYGVSGTPTFFINSVMLVGAQPYSVFQQAIEAELEK